MILEFEQHVPTIDPTAFVAVGAQLIGQVQLGPESSIWYNCVLRADVNRIVIGARSNIQDGTVIHCDSAERDPPGTPTLIGDEVLVGHMAMLHGCTLHDRAFVGLGSIVMDGCEIEEHGMLAAGALLTSGKIIRARQLWAGRPAKYVRDLREDEVDMQRMGVAGYVELARRHRQALQQTRD
jgi:carbonic anhydrase/acetyltransferase-like protein (isoleucine patch superfamily)